MSENIRYDVEEVTSFGSTEQKFTPAELKAQAMFRMWRDRLSGDAPDEPVTASYNLEQHGGDVALASPDRNGVDVVVRRADGRELQYGLHITEETIVLEAVGLSEGENAPDEFEVYDHFSRMLFDCDRSEMRR